MAPTRPTAFRSLTSRQSYEGHDEGASEIHIQHAGRTATPLAAQVSAQSLRQASRPKRHRREKSNSLSTLDLRQSRVPVIDIIAANVAQARRARLQSSLIALPSEPSGDNEDSFSAVRDNDGDGERYRSNSLTDISEPWTRRPSIKPAAKSSDGLLMPPAQHSKGRRRSFTSPSTLSQPRSVRDLGSDYTRYFNPFATPTPSCNDLRAQPSCPHLMSGAIPPEPAQKLTKRLSDPFDDTKRLSQQSLEDSATVPKAQQSKINSHAAGLTLLTVPARADTPHFIHAVDPEKAAFFQYVDDRLGAPASSFPYFSDPKEDDDDFHMPHWDDDIKLKPKLREYFTRENIVSTFGAFLMILGLITIFIVLPVVSYTGWGKIHKHPTPSEEHGWDWINDVTHPLMRNVRHGLIDPDTPKSAMTRESVTGKTLKLVFSDEFNASNRTFYPGDDPYWFGFDGWYGATQDLEWYDPDAANTYDGTLNLQLDAFANHNLPYRSGMLNSWNQLCFKGGVFEVSMSLPGPAGVHGLWPGAWTMGNLGRPGYLATTDGMWPYTYNECDAGITPNQSMTDGTSYLPGQRLPSCTYDGEDHPTPGTGRGAPEIDIAEVSGDWGGLGWGVATQSYQVAPFDIWWYPDYDFMETPNYNLSFVNTYTGGPFQQAISTTTTLNNTWYDDLAYQKFAFEYHPGTESSAFIAWTIGSDEMMRFDARAIGPNGNIGQRIISEEPMSLILNLGISHNWVDIDFAALRFPTALKVDYVRWYQREGEEMVTCDPPGYETTEYIQRHPVAYRNPNVTLWEEAGYVWPRNSLMHGCAAARGEKGSH